MHKYFTIILSFALMSCFTENKEVLVKKKIIILPLNQSITAQEVSIYKSKSNNSVYFFLGPFANKIYQFDLTTSICLDSFNISTKVGMIEDFQVINDTFVFQLYNSSIFALQPILDSSKCKTFRYPMQYENNYISYGSVYYNGLLYARFPNNCIVGTQNGWAKHFENPLINIFKFEQDSLRLLESYGSYPNEYKTGLLPSIPHRFIIPEQNTLYISHDFSEYVKKYNLTTKEFSEIKITSNYFKPIKLIEKDKVGDNYYENRVINNNPFAEFIYNPYRHEFYRYFIHKHEKNKPDMASIVIYSIKSKKNTEVLIERSNYTRRCQIFSTPNGFALIKDLTTKRTKKQPLVLDEFILD